MILSDKFIEEVQVLDAVDLNQYEKIINFAISYIVKHDTQTTLAEVLEIDENEADRLFKLGLKLVSYFGKFKFGDRQFRQNVEFLKFKEDRKAMFLQKLEANSTQLHKRLGFIESDGTPYFKNLEWRYDIQIASRGYEEEFKPRIFMKFDLEYDNARECGKIEQVLLETDYANLKNLQQEINYLVSQLESARQQKIKKLGQML
ncbi:unnamed protein product [Paramecium sonneborni]|uniref:COMM domain-containing protein n=1 Tax=Paramecium sonneborni TaxID=65129 RepID=A0A8S1R3C9_9CILI|nr:unnamed protein product [Paramecium sonneborni]